MVSLLQSSRVVIPGIPARATPRHVGLLKPRGPAQSARRARRAPTTTATSAMKTQNVDFGERSYPIYIGQRILDDSQSLLRKHITGKTVRCVNELTPLSGVVALLLSDRLSPPLRPSPTTQRP